MQAVFYGHEAGAADRVEVALRMRWPSSWVRRVGDAAQMLSELRESRPDLVILGPLALEEDQELVQQVRELVDGVIIVLSDEPSDTQLLQMLDAGADDYLAVTVGPAHLVARVCAALRRVPHTPLPSDAVATCGSLTIDAVRHEAYVGEREVYLTPTEFKLLYHLAENQGTLVTRETLHDLIWGCEHKVYIETLRKHIERLRRKIQGTPESDIRIVSVPRLGYKLLESAAASPAVAPLR